MDTAISEEKTTESTTENKVNASTVKKKIESPVNALINDFVYRIKHMTSIEPIIGNMIAIGLAVGILALLGHPSLFPKWLTKYHIYLTYAIYFGMSIQLLKSANQSILLPLLALAIAGIGFWAMNLEPKMQLVGVTTLQLVMLLGVLGMAISIIKIK